MDTREIATDSAASPVGSGKPAYAARIERVMQQAAKLGSRATTLPGAIRYLRATDLGYVEPMGRPKWPPTAPHHITVPPNWCDRRSCHGAVPAHWPSWADYSYTHWGTTATGYRPVRTEYRSAAEMYHRQQSRARFALRMERLSRAAMHARGLLDREQYTDLCDVLGSDSAARHAAARMRRMTPEHRAARLASILAASDEADRLTCDVIGPIAVSLAESYHRHIHSVYQSSRAVINYGPVTEDYDYPYGGSYKSWKARWTNAGVTVEYHHPDGPLAIIHTSRGAHISIPLHRDATYDHPALIDGDLYARERHGVVLRYSVRDQQTGVAIRVPAMAGMRREWEHGATVEACRTEYERKMAIRRERMLAQLRDPNTRQDRRIRLIARLCHRMVCTIEDARAAGHCQAGIDGFRSRYGIGDTATADTLRATSRPEIQGVVLAAARRIGKARRREAA